MDWMRLSGKLTLSLIIWAMGFGESMVSHGQKVLIAPSGRRIDQYHEVPKRA
jgi:hypothetical protein